MLAHYSHCLYLVLFATGEGRGKTAKRKTAKAIVSVFFSGSQGSHVWLAGSLARTLATLHDVTKIQTKKLSLLLSFYFHVVLQHLKTFIQTNFRFKI